MIGKKKRVIDRGIFRVLRISHLGAIKSKKIEYYGIYYKTKGKKKEMAVLQEKSTKLESGKTDVRRNWLKEHGAILQTTDDNP